MSDVSEYLPRTFGVPKGLLYLDDAINCLPARDAKTPGGNAQEAVLDASRDPSEFALRLAMARLAQANVIPASERSVRCEVQQQWNRSLNAQFAALHAMVAQDRGAVMECHACAQHAVKDGHGISA